MNRCSLFLIKRLEKRFRSLIPCLLVARVLSFLNVVYLHLTVQRPPSLRRVVFKILSFLTFAVVLY